ncbi:hypothetical protein E2C01_030947 [Portunus trituberculatus]|uniref:Uncharacterized protein n=1 Tax=Portunus trituberculatus TaxID=210409 RepID=A0A5B7EWA0_PORTR|nr:hypothetical protein [Portunus trituberculatus]
MMSKPTSNVFPAYSRPRYWLGVPLLATLTNSTGSREDLKRGGMVCQSYRLSAINLLATGEVLCCYTVYATTTWRSNERTSVANSVSTVATTIAAH